MKKLLFLILLIITSQVSFSQTVCKIFYSYDPNGDRIQRKYDCYTNTPENHVNETPFTPTLYPNPTDGPFTAAFNELVKKARISVYTVDGGLIEVREAEECYEVDLDIRDYAAGSYVVSMWVLRDDETEASQDFTLIKSE